MRSYLEEDAMTVGDRRLQGVGEKHRATDVLPPVRSVVAIVHHPRTSRRRVHVERGWRRPQRLERGQQLVVDLRHHLAVVGHLDLEEAVELSGRGELGGNRFQRRCVPREGDRVRAVDGRDGHLRGEAFNARRRLVGVQPDGEHRSFTCKQRLQPASLVGNQHGVAEA
jgi:hypothetical protein